jgi:alpha-beta hydrolase superfamily lysophospholipase
MRQQSTVNQAVLLIRERGETYDSCERVVQLLAQPAYFSLVRRLRGCGVRVKRLVLTQQK